MIPYLTFCDLPTRQHRLTKVEGVVNVKPETPNVDSNFIMNLMIPTLLIISWEEATSSPVLFSNLKGKSGSLWPQIYLYST